MHKWINLYGAPRGYSGSTCNKMNEDPKIASEWKGRIFVEYWCEDVKCPLFKIRDITDMSTYEHEMNSPKNF